MIVLVGFGGILGTLLRFYLGRWVAIRTARRGSWFPWGTWIINISGSLLLGILTSLHFHGTIPDWSWLILCTGFCGAYTTFSTFGYETVSLIEGGHVAQATLYVLSSLGLGLVAAWSGMQLF
ncbi:fluoride efflux transporter CrcB [Paenibacillus sanguinis]|uniref:fluoride efflux transporter CrcB n=1 Tax=Paenibacillus sanguinis TaxID=225906 RepID=UPI00036AA183|nr:fluoride efflux transporter CrcB [Paenibacillus sanguinis]